MNIKLKKFCSVSLFPALKYILNKVGAKVGANVKIAFHFSWYTYASELPKSVVTQKIH